VLLESFSPQALPAAVGLALALALVSFGMMLRASRQAPCSLSKSGLHEG